MSVVIPALNEAERIGRCLDSLLVQEELPDEIVVVDNASRDATRAVAMRLAERMKESGVSYEVVREPTRGVAKARNAGFRAVTGEVVISLDADALADREMVRNCRRYFENDEGWVGIAGMMRMGDGPKWVRYLTDKGYFGWFFGAFSRIFGFCPMSTCCAAYRRSAFWDVGGFDERLVDPNSLDDLELAGRLAGVGRVIVARDVWVTTSYRRFDKRRRRWRNWGERTFMILRWGWKYRRWGN